MTSHDPVLRPNISKTVRHLLDSLLWGSTVELGWLNDYHLRATRSTIGHFRAMWKVISLSSSTLRQGLRFHTMSASINWWTSIPSRQAIMAHCAGSRRRVMPADGTQLHLTGVAIIFSQWVRNNSVIASHLQKLPYFAAYGLLAVA